MVHSGHSVYQSKATILGLTFKENCSDIRNSKVVDIVREFEKFGVSVQVHDPLADPSEAKKEYDIELKKWEELQPASAIVVAVAHREYKGLNPCDIQRLSCPRPVLIDVKAVFDRKTMSEAGIRVWRL